MAKEDKDQAPESPPRAIDKIYAKTKNTASAVGRAVSEATERGNQAASSAKGSAEEMLGKASGSAMSAVGAVGDGFDVVSGKRILELVEQRLELQAQYNDVLATKLEEALRRLDLLEGKVQR